MKTDPLPEPDKGFRALMQSYLTTQRQLAHGQYMAGETVSRIRYEYNFQSRRTRRDLFFVQAGEAESAIRRIGELDPAEDHLIFVLVDRPGLIMSYMALGCSYLAPPSFLMGHQLDEVTDPGPDLPEGVVTLASELSLIRSIEGVAPPFPEDLEDDRLRHYVASYQGQPAAYVRAARLSPQVSWASHLYTANDHRGNGLATALMSQLMADCARAGDRVVLLLASEKAHQLYRRLGFQDLLPVLNFVLPTAR